MFNFDNNSTKEIMSTLFHKWEAEAQSSSFPSHEARTLQSYNSDSGESDSQAHALTTSRPLTEGLLCDWWNISSTLLRIQL